MFTLKIAADRTTEATHVQFVADDAAEALIHTAKQATEPPNFGRAVRSYTQSAARQLVMRSSGK